MTKLIDLTGKIFGKLKVIKRCEDYILSNGVKKTQWLCICECGNYCKVQSYLLTHGYTTSCGCYRTELIKKRSIKHHRRNTRIYAIWCGIKARCKNTKHKGYNFYGGRGISICKEWDNDFTAFYNWSILNGYDETAQRGECTIDRIDVNGNYEPNNCRWINAKMQANNTRKNHYLTYNNETHTIAQWSDITGLSTSCLQYRISKNWNIKDILTKPSRVKSF